MWVGVAATQGGPGDDFSAVVRASSCILAEVQLVGLSLVAKKWKSCITKVTTQFHRHWQEKNTNSWAQIHTLQ